MLDASNVCHAATLLPYMAETYDSTGKPSKWEEIHTMAFSLDSIMILASCTSSGYAPVVVMKSVAEHSANKMEKTVSFMTSTRLPRSPYVPFERGTWWKHPFAPDVIRHIATSKDNQYVAIAGAIGTSIEILRHEHERYHSYRVLKVPNGSFISIGFVEQQRPAVQCMCDYEGSVGCYVRTYDVNRTGHNGIRTACRC
jgi:hypothetical protein